MTPLIEIKRPNSNEVRRYTIENVDEHYQLQEDALNKLFFKTYPKNDEIENILIKTSSLNDFYSTNIFSIFHVAKHIYKLKIDERLAKADLGLVSEIAKVKIGDKEKNFYSFASKYCSHHQPLKFPIYDYYVDTMLKYFQKIDGFYKSKKMDLKNYEIFCGVINEFIKFYDLGEFNIRQIDVYLWQLGKAAFPRNYKKKTKI